MKKSILTFFVFLLPIMSYCREYNTFTIVGKGDSGQYECKGEIKQEEDSGFGYSGNIEISISDMITKRFHIEKREIKDEKTIIYTTSDENWKKDYIVKYKCPYGKDVYFFVFPPLYNGQGRTTYKAKKFDIHELIRKNRNQNY